MSYEDDGEFNVKTIGRRIKKVEKILRSKYKKLGQGAYRAVYDYDDKRVIKCPIDDLYDELDNGIRANLVEYHFYLKYKHLRLVPKTSIKWIEGVPCVLMNKLDMITHCDDDELDAFQAKLDSHGIDMWDGNYQLGKDGKGTVRSCDAGNEDEQLDPEVRNSIDAETIEIYKKLEKPTKKEAKKKSKELQLLLS